MRGWNSKRAIVIAASALTAVGGWSAGRASALEGLQVCAGWSALDALDPTLDDRGAFSRSDWGDFDGDGHLDVLALEGDRVFVLFNAGATFAMSALPGTSNGACALRGATTRIAATSSAGLSVVAFDPVLEAFTSQLVLAGEWTGALELRAFDCDADGESEVFGIRADRSGVLMAREVAGAWSSLPTLAVSGAVRDVVALQWDADAGLELAVLTDTGVYVYDGDQTLLNAWNSAFAGGALARVSQAGQSLDRLAWISAYAPPNLQWLRTLSADGSFEHIDLGALDAYALASADFDADGDSDLLIAPRHGNALLWLENLRTTGQPSCPTFVVAPSTARVFEFPEKPVGAPATTQLAWPAVADFDGDGDFDMVIGIEATRSLLTRLGDWIDDGPQRCALLDAHYDAEEMRLDLGLAPPLAGLAATHWLVDVWRAEDEHAQLDGQAQASFEVPAPLTALALELDEASAAFEAVYRLRLTPIQRNAQGAVVARGCPTLLAFAVSEAAALALQQEAAVESIVEPESILPENVSAQPVVARGRRMSAFKSGERPQGAAPATPQ